MHAFTSTSRVEPGAAGFAAGYERAEVVVRPPRMQVGLEDRQAEILEASCDLCIEAIDEAKEQTGKDQMVLLAGSLPPLRCVCGAAPCPVPAGGVPAGRTVRSPSSAGSRTRPRICRKSWTWRRSIPKSSML